MFQIVYTRSPGHHLLVWKNATPINSGEQYFVKLAGRQAGKGCADEAFFMGYLNKTCSASGPVLRSASSGNTWTTFTLTKVGKSPQGEDLVEIKTYYPASGKKPLCQGYVVPEKKDACRGNAESMAGKVHIQAKKGDVWALSAVKKKKDTYTVRAYSRKSGCLKFLAAAFSCSKKYLQLDAKDGSGRQQWVITPVKPPPASPPPRKSPPPSPPLFVEIPAVNYSIAVTGYTKETFGPSQQTAFCNSIYNSTTYRQDWMECVIALVTDVPYQGSTSSSRKLTLVNTVYVRGYTAFEFIYGNDTSKQEAENAANALYQKMNSPTTLQNIPSPTPASPTLSPEYNTVPGGDGVILGPPIPASPIPSPVPVPTPTPTPVPTPLGPKAYIANYQGKSITVCSYANGAFTTCSSPDTGAGFFIPYGIAISGSNAYITNFFIGVSNVITCSIGNTGAFTTCSSPYTGPVVDTFKLPRGIAIFGSYAYVVNTGTQSVTSCSMSGGLITACNSPYSGLAGAFNVPYYIAISDYNAYVTNIGPPGSIAVCSIGGGGSISCLNPPDAQIAGIGIPYGIAISGSLAYVVIRSSSIAVCSIDNSGIVASSCTGYPSANLNTPSGIAIDGSYAYVTNEAGNSVSACPLDGNGAVLSCGTGFTGIPYTGFTGTFNNPQGIALS